MPVIWTFDIMDAVGLVIALGIGAYILGSMALVRLADWWARRRGL
jgi:hypothetical protein